MTPAIKAAQKLGLAFTLHEYQHQPGVASYGLEAAPSLGLSVTRVYKTLLVQEPSGQLAVAMIAVDKQLNLKRVAKALGQKKVQMADAQVAERVTGYQVGGISALGQKRRLKTLLDSAAQQQTSIHISAGRRGLEIELCPKSLVTALGAQWAEISG